MRIAKRVRAAVALSWMLSTASAFATEPGADPRSSADTPETIVVVSAGEGGSDCDGATPMQARVLADKASKDGAYQRAGECYLAAGEQALADQAFVKAFAQNGVDTSHKLAANLDEVKAQARQIKLALHRGGR